VVSRGGAAPGAPDTPAADARRRGSAALVVSRSQAQVDMWIDYSSNEIDGPMSTWIYPLLGIWPYDKKARRGARRRPSAAARSYAHRPRPAPRRRRRRPPRR
jgi:hypothetical protein